MSTGWSAHVAIATSNMQAFATAADRAGMHFGPGDVTYLIDVKQFQYWDGTAWQNLAASRFSDPNDVTAMAASQTFTMTATSGTLNWVGPNSPAASWMPNADGRITVPGIYGFRYRFWVQTVPGAAGIKIVTDSGGGLGYDRVFNVDDLTFANAQGYRPGYEIIRSFSASQTPPYAAAPIFYNLSAADATGVLKYDMACWRMTF
jgi:hypothetical protein